MILILSTSIDVSAKKVANYLYKNGVEYKVLTPEDITNIKNIDVKNGIFYFKDDTSLCILDVKIAWYRKWETNDYNVNLSDKFVSKEINKVNSLETKSITDLLFNLLTFNSKWLCNPFNSRISKLEQYYFAHKAKLLIPDTIVTSSKDNLSEFKNKHKGEIINKTIVAAPFFYLESGIFQCYTNNVSNLENYKDTFLPSLFQKKINRDFEIRIFFIDNKLFSSAIILDESTNNVTDIRSVDTTRVIPFQLPYNMEKKIIEFMKSIGLNTGSIDLIKTKTDNYIFLEVNPQGQYDYYSNICNYNIDYEIANSLMKYE